MLDHPTEASEHDIEGRQTYGGWHWSCLDNADELFKETCEQIKQELKPMMLDEDGNRSIFDDVDS